MIYLLSSDHDSTTSEIIEWLDYYNKEYKRINDIMDFDDLYLDVDSDISYSLSGNSTKAHTTNSLWYRKLGISQVINKDIADFYKKEALRVIELLFSGNWRIIGKPFFIEINKLDILAKVKKYGINIPGTIITNSKEKVSQFLKKHRKIITKPISEIFVTEIKGKKVMNYVKLLNKKLIDSLPDKFQACKFQQFVDKEFDIRIFYFDGRLYPMAIFSQKDKKTRIDFRNYNHVNPNRTVPYKLPSDIEEKLISFMKNEKMEAASVDLVKCKYTGKYYFLEVNPWGQFGMVSKPCNYYLEMKIAQIL